MRKLGGNSRGAWTLIVHFFCKSTSLKLIQDYWLHSHTCRWGCRRISTLFWSDWWLFVAVLVSFVKNQSVFIGRYFWKRSFFYWYTSTGLSCTILWIWISNERENTCKGIHCKYIFLITRENQNNLGAGVLFFFGVFFKDKQRRCIMINVYK